jgi:hypothetical protein
VRELRSQTSPIVQILCGFSLRYSDHSQNQELSQFPDLVKVAKQRGEVEFDVSGIDDEGFWLQAEQKILDALSEYASSAQLLDQKRLFAADTAKGFAFIDLCMKNFDVVLMNPPFGEASTKVAKYLSKNYTTWAKNILCPFFERMKSKLSSQGLIGAIFDRTVAVKSTYEGFRREIFPGYVHFCLDTGWDTLDANVETTCYVIDNKKNNYKGLFFDVRDIPSNELDEEIGRLLNEVNSKRVYIRNSLDFTNLPNSVLSYDFPQFAIKAFRDFRSLFLSDLTARQGHALVSEQHFRKYWEAPINEVILKYELLYNGGAYRPYYMPYSQLAYKSSHPSYWKTNGSVVLRNLGFQKKNGVGFGKRGEFIDAHAITEGTVFTTEGQAFTEVEEELKLPLLGFINSSIAQYLINLYCGQHKYSGYINLLPFPDLTKKDIALLNELIDNILQKSKYIASFNECNICFSGLVMEDSKELKRTISNVMSKITSTSDEIQRLAETTNLVFDRYFLNDDISLTIMEKFKHKRPNYSPLSLAGFSLTQEGVMGAFVSYFVGVYFNRWEKECIINKGSYFDEVKLVPSIQNTDSEVEVVESTRLLEGVAEIFYAHLRMIRISEGKTA